MHPLSLDDTFSEARITSVQLSPNLAVLPLIIDLVPLSLLHLDIAAPGVNTLVSSPSVSPTLSL